jgi:hypothetical protein
MFERADLLWHTEFEHERRPSVQRGRYDPWIKEHAWKTTPATPTEQHQNTSSRNQFNDLPL